MAIKRSYVVNARWDEDAQVFWSDSDIRGLHIEAATLEEFEELVGELAPDLIFENHLQRDELATTPPKDLIPSVVLRTPELGTKPHTQPKRGQPAASIRELLSRPDAKHLSISEIKEETAAGWAGGIERGTPAAAKSPRSSE